ncbi:hypothetical protein Glove_243g93 [Diversispora epigaea]|uniref:Uncharacterized protein n=1 Tax=Diversispora epigaea TaxID=1348612 RepID=A0A397IHU5_9GLOM|nr:hypothetical protein Glove_243g93 [Diversispora epigaea]
MHSEENEILPQLLKAITILLCIENYDYYHYHNNSINNSSFGNSFNNGTGNFDNDTKNNTSNSSSNGAGSFGIVKNNDNSFDNNVRNSTDNGSSNNANNGTDSSFEFELDNYCEDINNESYKNINNEGFKDINNEDYEDINNEESSLQLQGIKCFPETSKEIVPVVKYLHVSIYNNITF